MRFKSIIFCSLFLLLSVKLFALSLKETITYLGSPPKDYRLIPVSITPSPHLNHLGFVCISKDKQSMVAVIDGKETVRFQKIARGYPKFSPTGKDFLVVGERKDEVYVLINNSLSKGYDEIYKALFTPNGKKIIFIVTKNNQEFLVENEKEWKKYKRIAEKISPVISPDSKKIAIVALKDSGKTTISVNNKELGEYDLVLMPKFSPNSKHIAYIVKEKGKYRVLLDGQHVGDSYDQVKDIQFSPDSKKIAFVAKKGNEFFVVVNGKKQKGYQFVGSPIFSFDGKHMAYMAYDHKKMFIVLDNTPGPQLDEIGIYFFSKQNNLLYIGVKEKQAAIFINNKPEKFYDSVGLPVVSSDGNHVAYRARKANKWFIVLDGKKGKDYELVRRPKFSKNGKHMAYIAIKNKKYIIVKDNKENKEYNWTDFPYFSKDGSHLAYVASDGKNSFIVLDGVEAKERFFGFLKGVPLIFKNNCVTGQALKMPGPKFYKVTVCVSP